MKIYPKTYEDVFSSERSLKKCKLDKITTDIGMGLDEYTDLFKKSFKSFEVKSFNELVKLAWLMRRFCYYGNNRNRMNSNGVPTDRAFSIFIRNYVGYSHSDIKLFYPIISYFDDFFPYFDTRNPFKENLKYPFKYIGFGHLSMVHQMDERMELLKMADKKRMTYAKFVDYVINYLYCLNDEMGEEIYRFISQHHFYEITPHVKRIKKT